jgi:hypothetical protein
MMMGAMRKRTHSLAALAFCLFAVCSCGATDDVADPASPSTTAAAVTSTMEPDATATSAPPTRSSEFSTPAPAAISYGTGTAQAFLVGTRVDFAVTDQGTITRDADGSQHSRDGAGSSTFVGNDPRITGTETFSFNSDRWGTGLANGAITQWGTATIETADGTWEGTFSGVFTSATTDVITWWLTGAGAYEGMSMFMWTTETNTRGEGVNYALVFPGDPPVETLLP